MIDVYDPNLIFKGLKVIYEKNQEDLLRRKEKESRM
jgi:hypothetical protein